MTEKAMEPFGLALKDYYNGKKRVKVIFYRDDDDYFDFFLS